MKKLAATLLATAAIGAPLAFASTASAAVFISFNGVTPLAGGTFADGVFSFNALCSPVSKCGGFTAVGVSGQTGDLPSLLHTASVDATTSKGAAANLTIYVTRDNITGPDFDLFGSSFTSNNSVKTGGTKKAPIFTTPFTVTMSTYLSPTNALFGGSLLSTFSTSAPGATSFNASAAGLSGHGPYSVTEKYVLSATAFGRTESASPTITLDGTHAVPEPATWALLIGGFGGIGAVARSNRRRGITTA
jgi:hypothetical protein